MIVRLPSEIKEFLKRRRHEFDTPQCYLGTEPNTHTKKWDDSNIKLRVLLAAPWRYEDFRGNQTFPLLYQMLNSREDVLCDRAFFPNTEKEYKLFCKYKIPIFGLETQHSMGEYDVVMTSLSFLPPWVNFPLMLEMSGIPARWSERQFKKHPLILVGGSAVYGNFSIVYPVVDLIYLGDAEPGLDALLALLVTRPPLEVVQSTFDFVLCPKFYSPVYEKEKFFGWARLTGMPKKLKIIRQEKLDDAPALVRPIPSYTDTTMGLGEIEISRGCRASCVFCGIGWKYRPYRERSRENMFKLMQENRLNSGAITYCPVATEFAYYSEKQGLISDLMQVAHGVDPLSMRVDAFIDDPEFDSILAERGMNQVALGVEAVSQRLRNRLMKGVTEEQILRACEIGLSVGFKRLKFFMISNIDETPEDFEEFFALLRKIRKLEVPYGPNKTGKRTGNQIQITASWTPWFIEPCTPIQWKRPTIEQRQDWRKVDDVVREELGAKFKLGIKNAEDFLWTMQGMHLGDTRFAEALVTATLRLKRPFYVSFTKKMKTTLTECFKLTGYSWDYLMREREAEEEFPWDIVDRGVTKKALRTIYEKVVSGQMDANVHKVKVPVDRVNISVVKGNHPEITKRYWWAVRYRITEEMEVVPSTHLKALIHKAAFQTGFPLAVNSTKFFTDRDVRNWFGGWDVFVYGTPFDTPASDAFLSALPFETDGVKFIGKVKPPLKWRNFFSEYDVTVPFGKTEVEQAWSDMKERESIMVSVPTTRYFAGAFRKKKLDIVEAGVYYDVPLVVEKTPVTSVLRSLRLGHEVGIRYFLQVLFPHTSFSKVLQFKVTKKATKALSDNYYKYPFIDDRLIG